MSSYSRRKLRRVHLNRKLSGTPIVLALESVYQLIDVTCCRYCQPYVSRAVLDREVALLTLIMGYKKLPMTSEDDEQRSSGT